MRLEAGEEVAADFLGATEVGNGVGQGVVIFETEQRRELFLIDLVDALFDIVGTNEIQENLLLAADR